MRNHFLRHFLTVLCLVAFGFQAVAGNLLVKCKDAGGGTHLEWGGCDPDDLGGCTKPCDQEDSEEEPAPCEDTPVKAEVGTATARSSSVSALFNLELPTFVAESVVSVPFPSIAKSMRIEVRAAAPPAAASLRTIVMLV